MRSVILNGMTRNAQAASVNMEELFGTRKVATYPLQPLFQVDSVEEVEKLAAKAKTKKNNPQVEISPCVPLPKHIALALLDAENASTVELFLVVKEAIISKLTTAPLDETTVPGDVTIPTQGVDEDLNFSSATVMAHGGEVLQWLLASLDEKMAAADATVPMSGTLIQQAARDAEYCRLGREAPQSAIHQSSNDRASLAESFESLRGILDGATEKFVEKSSGSKVNDKLFLAQLRMAASTDKRTQGNLSETGMLIWKTKDLDSKRSLFARDLRAKGVADAVLSAAQSKSFCVGDWHFNPANPGGTSIHLMSAPGVENEDIEENHRIITTKLQLMLQDKITDNEFRKYSDKSIKVPSSMEEMIEVLQLQCTCFEVFLTSESIVVDSYETFIADLREMRGRLRQKIAGDKDYIFTIMHLVDLTWNSFFEQCYMYFDRPELIDFENIELNRIVSKIKNHELKIDVFPAYYKKLTMEKGGTKDRERETDTEPATKKTRKALTNSSPNRDWCLKAEEDFATFQDAPGRSKPGKVCLKWWMLNECDSGCRKKKSHHVLTDQQKKEMNTFLKTIRKEK